MRWSAEDIERVRSLAAARTKAETIAAVFGVSKNAVIGLCDRNGFALGNAQPRTPIAPVAQIEPSPKDVRREAVLDAWAAGATAGTIAQRFPDLSRSAVSGLIARARSQGDKRAVERPKVASVGRIRRAAPLPRKKGIRPTNYAQMTAPSPGEEVIEAIRETAPEIVAEIDQPGESDTAVLFLDARFNQCRYPLWSGRPDIATAQVCGAPTVRRASGDPCPYCARHFTLTTGAPRGMLSNRSMTRAFGSAA